MWRFLAGISILVARISTLIHRYPSPRTARFLRRTFFHLPSLIGSVGVDLEPIGAAVLFAKTASGSTVLADRLYGCAPFATHLLAACQRVGSHFLPRVPVAIRPRVIRPLKDGSRLIRVPVREKHRRQHILQWLELREIRVYVGRTGHQTAELRLWTTLQDPRTAPGVELAQVYARRWEHELYLREVKRQLRKSAVLQSHTVETAAQGIAAVVLASALLAAERERVTGGHVPALRVSSGNVLELVKPMWLTLQLGEGLPLTPTPR